MRQKGKSGQQRRPFYCPTALLPYCPTALLPYCPTALLPYCPTSPPASPYGPTAAAAAAPSCAR
ncbi:hypothetical protein FJ938_21750 [Mesorhizobium sp. B2-4-14]|nr:hypothetical protein FJ938_21750 [Mesorhizobium sp. B2-4-14]